MIDRSVLSKIRELVNLSQGIDNKNEVLIINGVAYKLLTHILYTTLSRIDDTDNIFKIGRNVLFASPENTNLITTNRI